MLFSRNILHRTQKRIRIAHSVKRGKRCPYRPALTGSEKPVTQRTAMIPAPHAYPLRIKHFADAFR